jgi:hypothetical protein
MLDDKRKHLLRQRKYRQKQGLLGFKRVELSLPPDLWARLEPRLKCYGDGRHPGESLVKLLQSLEFYDE